MELDRCSGPPVGAPDDLHAWQSEAAVLQSMCLTLVCQAQV